MAATLTVRGPRSHYPDHHPPLGRLYPLLPHAHRHPLTMPNLSQQLIQVTQVSMSFLEIVCLSNDTSSDTDQVTNLHRNHPLKWTATRIMKTCHMKTGGHQSTWRPVKKSLLPSERPLQCVLETISFLDYTDYILKRKTPVEDFIHIRDTLLLELCRHEGLRGLAVESSGFPLCGGCGDLDGTLRCTECSTNAMYCSRCMCVKHREQPLHRIQVC